MQNTHNSVKCLCETSSDHSNLQFQRKMKSNNNSLQKKNRLSEKNRSIEDRKIQSRQFSNFTIIKMKLTQLSLIKEWKEKLLTILITRLIISRNLSIMQNLVFWSVQGFQFWLLQRKYFSLQKWSTSVTNISVRSMQWLQTYGRASR